MYAYLISNGTSLAYGKHGMDITGCYHMDILSEMRHIYYMVRYGIDMLRWYSMHICWYTGLLSTHYEILWQTHVRYTRQRDYNKNLQCTR